jgi:hypothetical protein
MKEFTKFYEFITKLKMSLSRSFESNAHIHTCWYQRKKILLAESISRDG